MRINSKLGVQHATYDGDDAGEGLTIFFSQNAGSVSRYRFLVKARTDQGLFQLGVFYSSPPSATTPTGPLTRAIATAVCPGAKSWAVDISCADTEIASDDTADVVLISSKCCTAPVGVTRVGERYIYTADAISPGSVVITVPPGRVLKSYSAVANFGTDGFVQITAPSVLPAIGVPAGFSVQAEPGAAFIGVEQITITNVTFFAEYLEGA